MITINKLSSNTITITTQNPGLTNVTYTDNSTRSFDIQGELKKGDLDYTSPKMAAKGRTSMAKRDDDTPQLMIVHVGTGVNALADDVFEDSGYAEEITIPSSVLLDNLDQISGMFNGCSSLRRLFIYADNTGGSELPEGAFQGATFLVSIRIPTTITSIPAGAFYNCGGLSQMNLPESSQEIGIIIPENVESIGERAFCNPSGGAVAMNNVVVPSATTSIGGNAFFGHARFTNLTINSTMAEVEGMKAPGWGGNYWGFGYYYQKGAGGTDVLVQVDGATIHCSDGDIDPFTGNQTPKQS